MVNYKIMKMMDYEIKDLEIVDFKMNYEPDGRARIV